MPNPVLNDKSFEKAEQQAGWAAPALDNQPLGPITDGPISPYTPIAREGVMTMGGVVTATGVLFAVLLVGGAVGWSAVDQNPATGQISFPAWLLLPLFGALGVGIFLAFKPRLAKFLAPLYALLQGMVLGAISAVYNAQWSGIVVQAVGMTLAVFAVMLFLFATRIIKVTQRMRKIIIGATLGVMLFYGISLLLSLFGVEPAYFSSASGWSIALSIGIAGLAAFNLLLDFDIIERGVAAGAPKWMEWMAAFGLMVTLVWLYLEILRLLGKLRSN